MSAQEANRNCCDDWRDAKQSGTDNDGYGRLIMVIGGEAMMGCGLPHVAFCPWCGADKRPAQTRECDEPQPGEGAAGMAPEQIAANRIAYAYEVGVGTPLQIARRAVEAISAAELLIVPGATHLFEEPGTLDAAAHLAGSWFAARLGNERNRAIGALTDLGQFPAIKPRPKPGPGDAKHQTTARIGPNLVRPGGAVFGHPGPGHPFRQAARRALPAQRG